jgi:NitT/TauT family transport system substrate-binding protein
MNRRAFVSGLTAAGAAGLVGGRALPAAAEPPLETTRLRIVQIPGICVAPQYVAEELLRGEGFTDVQYVKRAIGPTAIYQDLASAEADMSMAFVAPFIIQADAGDPIVLLAGVHVGCYELFGGDRVRAIRDLKGKTVSVPGLGSAHHVFLATILAHVGLDPKKDVTFVTQPAAEGMKAFAEGKVDAYMGFPPDPQELRARKVGRVIVNSAIDRPWSQYFCCVAAGNREFVRRHPVATKRALRAILKASNICAAEPERAARLLVDKGFAKRYEYALQTMKELPYARWRDYSVEDTVRYYALRLHEVGMIKTNPQKIVAQITDWRFLNEIKKELKG